MYTVLIPQQKLKKVIEGPWLGVWSDAPENLRNKAQHGGSSSSNGKKRKGSRGGGEGAGGGGGGGPLPHQHQHQQQRNLFPITNTGVLQYDASFATMNEKFEDASKSSRAWNILLDICERDLVRKMQAGRSAGGGEVMDEKSRKHMEWFCYCREEGLKDVVALSTDNAGNEAEKAKQVIIQCYSEVKAIYQAYAALDAGPRMSQKALQAFFKDTSVAKNIPRHTLDSLCSAAAAPEPREGESFHVSGAVTPIIPLAPSGSTVKRRGTLHAKKRNVDEPLIPRVFTEVLIRLAALKYTGKSPTTFNAFEAGDGPEEDEAGIVSMPLHQALRKMLHDDIFPTARSSEVDGFRRQAHHPTISKLHRKHGKALVKIFKQFSTCLAAEGETPGGVRLGGGPRQSTASAATVHATDDVAHNFLLLDDFLRMCNNFKLIDTLFTAKDAANLFPYIANDDSKLMTFSMKEELEAEEHQQQQQQQQQQQAHHLSASNLHARRRSSVASMTKTAGAVDSSAKSEMNATTKGPQGGDGGGGGGEGGNQHNSLLIREGGMGYSDWLDVLTSIALYKTPSPFIPLHVKVANMFKMAFGSRLKEHSSAT